LRLSAKKTGVGLRIPELPGVFAYGKSKDPAVANVRALALRVVVDRLGHGERVAEPWKIFALFDDGRALRKALLDAGYDYDRI
jgi:hypothetical protein